MKRTVPFTKTITFRTMIAEITNIEVTHTLELKHDHEIEGDILVDGTYKMTDASQIEEEFHYKLPFMIEIDSKYDTKNLEITIGDFYFEIINEEDLKVNVEIDMDGLEEKQEEVELISTKISLDEPLEELDDIDDSKIEEEQDNKDEKEEELVRDSNVIEAEPIPVEIEEVKEKLEFQDNSTHPLQKLAEEIKQDLKKEEIEMNQIQSTPINKTTSTDKPTTVSSIFSSISSSEETFSTYYVYIVRESDTIESIMDKYQTTREELQNYNDLNNVKVGSKLIIPCPTHE